MRRGRPHNSGWIGFIFHYFPHISIVAILLSNLVFILSLQKNHETSHGEKQISINEEQLRKEYEDITKAKMQELSIKEKELQERESRIIQREEANKAQNAKLPILNANGILGVGIEPQVPVKDEQTPELIQIQPKRENPDIDVVEPIPKLNEAVSKGGEEIKEQDKRVSELMMLSNSDILQVDIKSELAKIDNKDDILRIASHYLDAKIEANQNPKDCTSAKWNYCRVFNNCGGGCVIHQLAYCFVYGLATGRINVIGDGWKYLRECEDIEKPWTCFFEPVTSCPVPSEISGASDTVEDSNPAKFVSVDLFSRGLGSQFIKWAASDGFHTNTPFYLPPELEIVRQIHGDARVWLVGHVESYMLRLNDKGNTALQPFVSQISQSFIHPVVGIHVRRTDHGREAPFRDLSEYLEKADKWFADQNLTGKERRIYLASDEPQVIKEAETNFKQYTWMRFESDQAISGSVKGFEYENGRSSMIGLISLLSDWYFLSRVDFFVGTSSSQVGRMAYELMQTFHPNAANNFVSLDDPWYFP